MACVGAMTTMSYDSNVTPTMIQMSYIQHYETIGLFGGTRIAQSHYDIRVMASRVARAAMS